MTQIVTMIMQPGMHTWDAFLKIQMILLIASHPFWEPLKSGIGTISFTWVCLKMCYIQYTPQNGNLKDDISQDVGKFHVKNQSN